MIETISSKRKKDYQKAWHQAHKKEANEYSKKYYRAHRKQAYEIKKKWVKANPENIKKSRQKFYQLHKELVLEQSKEWAKTHPENIRKARQKHYQTHRDQIIKRATKRNQTEKGRAYRLEYARKMKLDVITHYGDDEAKCVLCGHTKLTSLSIDHINGGGCKHRRESIKHNAFYRWLIKNNYPEGFRTLCLNCQFDERARLLEEKRVGRFFPRIIQGNGGSDNT